MTSDNAPPLPGTDAPLSPKPSFVAYVLRGVAWVEIGMAFPHEDGKGHQLRLDIAPADGDLVELRALDPDYFPGGGDAKPKRQRAPRRSPNPSRRW